MGKACVVDTSATLSGEGHKQTSQGIVRETHEHNRKMVTASGGVSGVSVNVNTTEHKRIFRINKWLRTAALASPVWLCG
jgi:hypothetical protein